MGCNENGRPAIMVVEDNSSFVYLIQRYAGKSGCRVVSTSVGEEALELARRERPKVIILDVVLPRMSGWDALRALKADRSTQDIPVVMCSGWDEELRAWAKKGADGCLQKPVRYHEFLKLLQRVGIEQNESSAGAVQREEPKMLESHSG